MIDMQALEAHLKHLSISQINDLHYLLIKSLRSSDFTENKTFISQITTFNEVFSNSQVETLTNNLSKAFDIFRMIEANSCSSNSVFGERDDLVMCGNMSLYNGEDLSIARYTTNTAQTAIHLSNYSYNQRVARINDEWTPIRCLSADNFPSITVIKEMYTDMLSTCVLLYLYIIDDCANEPTIDDISDFIYLNFSSSDKETFLKNKIDSLKEDVSRYECELDNLNN